MHSSKVNKINKRFRENGWTPIKELSDFDNNELWEDMAQFARGDVVIDFGHYSDGVNLKAGCFIIFIVACADWDNPLAKIEAPSADVALGILEALAGYDPRGDNTDLMS